MTPAINLAKKAKIFYKVHEYTHDAAHDSYGLEAAENLGVDDKRIFKTLLVDVDGKLVVGIIPVSSMMSMKNIAKASGGKKATMADKSDVECSTGYILGGVSPLDQKMRLKTVIDASAEAQETIYVSAGRRGLEIELKPEDLKRLVSAVFVELYQ